MGKGVSFSYHGLHFEQHNLMTQLMTSLHDVLACPRCDAKLLDASGGGYQCKSCKTDFPVLDGIPVLFPEPQFSLAEWRERLHRLILQFEHDAQAIQRELQQSKLLEPTKKRLQLMVDAYQDHVKRLQALLSPLDMKTMQASFDAALALRTRLPQRQGLTTYYVNLHRDWCWGGKENDLAAQQVMSAVQGDKPERLLVLGAGGARLAYDIHRLLKPKLTVALDINPLLLLAARKITSGESVELYEFPIAPKSIEDHAILRTLQASEKLDDNFHYVLADALHPPFAPGSFDMILTPWFVDILPEDLRNVVPRINRLLKLQGKWVNFGSLAFTHEAAASCYSLQEVLAILELTGFSDINVVEELMPYMQSPASRHGRIEQVMTLSAQKTTKAAKPTRYKSLPDWLIKNDLAVPLLPSFQTQSMSTRIHAFIMAMIDGQRSIQDMALMLEQQRLMSRDEAEPAIRSFLTKMYEEQLRAKNF